MEYKDTSSSDSRLALIVWHRLTGLMPGELNKAELAWLLSPHFHLALLTRRRATMVLCFVFQKGCVCQLLILVSRLKPLLSLL